MSTHVSPEAPALPKGYELKKKKPFYRKWWFIVLAAIVVMIVAMQAGGGSSSSSGPTAAGGSSDAAEDAVAGLNTPAADGKFTFTVSGVDCSATELGTAGITTTAQGVFCIVDVAVQNTGDEAQSFFGDNQTLLNAEGQEFSSDPSAAIYLADSSSLYSEINPGNTLNSKIIFDVPAGTTPTAIELHDSAFSGGVTVNLQ
ncbi:DUF4352 domain-containing protein [Modestobacter sp. I12A-02628]|uniref:DUF4352 domain-containing protein n=1 Tax=Goekera deserti TaxID=2497753 RepID=A0A7K3WG51_9ACTN|nr:DUF4352 domain-containing protein [Goekera deserti]MPQ96560.1 DUF4352 domain-containing protein [Goekera deserti]NDI47127.1 DUF4352 domain-containing protein [Goekera deserti]NEL55475.1 DUF4352 domain-containing protein [Goekera deserti]